MIGIEAKLFVDAPCQVQVVDGARRQRQRMEREDRHLRVLQPAAAAWAMFASGGADNEGIDGCGGGTTE